MNTQQKLIVLNGHVCSGKTTYAQNLAKETGAVVVGNDLIVTMLAGGDSTNYRPELRGLYKAVEMNAVQTSLEQGLTVIIDRPNLRREERERWVSLGKTFGVSVEIHQLPDPGLSIRLDRRMENPRGYDQAYWHSVLLKHKDQEDPMSAEEAFEVERVVIVGDAP